MAGRRPGGRSARCPSRIGTRTNLVGTPEQLAARVAAYREAGITTLLAKLEGSPEARLATLSTLVALVADGDPHG